MELANYIRERRRNKDLLIMAHVVCGYPSFEANMQALEIPVSKPISFMVLEHSEYHPSVPSLVPYM